MQEFYRKNQECLLLIPEIVELFREQSFFQASKKMEVFVGHLSGLVPLMQTEQDSQELDSILQFILQAQKQQDFILMADALEGELLPFLQKMQMELAGTGNVCFGEFLKENLVALQKKNHNLARQISELPQQTADAAVFAAINGQPTIKCQTANGDCCMHSIINPQLEAKLFAKKYVDAACSDYYIFGIGLGYHVLAVLESFAYNHVVVLEHDIQMVALALQFQDFADDLEKGRLEIVCRKDLTGLLREIGEAERVLVHYPTLARLPGGDIKNVLENYFISSNSMLEQGKSLAENFVRLQKMDLPECGALKGVFSGNDVVIVAGGPSLDRELPALKKYRDKVTVLTVGTSAKKLLSEGIVPDAIVISDPQDVMRRQVEGISHDAIPLILLSTASADVADIYPGGVYIAYQNGYGPAEQVAKNSGFELFQTGGSVTTLALDIALQFVAKRIILLGTDMAYTGGQSHAGGLGRTIADGVMLRKVESVDGTTVDTGRNLDIYRRWIEQRLCREKHITVYNTARGARIKGTVEMGLEDIFLTSD